MTETDILSLWIVAGRADVDTYWRMFGEPPNMTCAEALEVGWAEYEAWAADLAGALNELDATMWRLLP
jgi:hypothetical protein